MKLTPIRKHKLENTKQETGFATLLVFALVVILVAILGSNQLVLHNLKRELKLIEQEQLKKLQPDDKIKQPAQQP